MQGATIKMQHIVTACWLLQLRQSALSLDIEQLENVTLKSLTTVSQFTTLNHISYAEHKYTNSNKP